MLCLEKKYVWLGLKKSQVWLVRLGKKLGLHVRLDLKKKLGWVRLGQKKKLGWVKLGKKFGLVRLGLKKKLGWVKFGLEKKLSQVWFGKKSSVGLGQL